MRSVVSHEYVWVSIKDIDCKWITVNCVVIVSLLYTFMWIQFFNSCLCYYFKRFPYLLCNVLPRTKHIVLIDAPSRKQALITAKRGIVGK